jgi:TorA maturation chaperone TorD
MVAVTDASAPERIAEATDVASLLACREYLYTLFHKLFGGVPSRELLEALTGDATEAALGAYAEGSEALASAAGFLSSLHDGASSGLVDAVRDEYTRLFVGPAELVAYPWESPYVSKQASVCQESTLAVRRAYEAHGLQPRKLLRVPDDHVSLMCAFLSRLAGEARKALSTGDLAALAAVQREQESFVRGHLLGWLPEYAHFARRSKTAVLYPQMIETFADFVGVDATFLSESAFWAEKTTGDVLGEDAAGRMLRDAVRTCDSEESAAREQLVAATRELAALQLRGIEDNELVPVAA